MRIALSFFLSCFLFGGSLLIAQNPETHSLTKEILKMDSLIFDLGFNQCELAGMDRAVHDDFEFYHDISGETEGKEAFIDSFSKGICGDPERKYYRQLVPNHTGVFPLKNNGSIYGAFQTGEHLFFEQNIDEAPVLTGIARFSHLWIKVEGKWKLKRVISYDHHGVGPRH